MKIFVNKELEKTNSEIEADVLIITYIEKHHKKNIIMNEVTDITRSENVCGRR